jgi:hypothetical protein
MCEGAIADFSSMKNREESLLAEGIESPFKLPSMEIARTFAVETIDYPNPLGLQYVPLLSRDFG